MKKIKILVQVASLLLTSAFGFSQTEKTVLWEVSGNGLKSPSYLFGTIHMICPDDLKLSPKVNTALEHSEQLVLELDMDDPNFMTETQKLSVNPEMKNLSSSLSGEDLNSLNVFYKKHYGADMSQLGIMKPLALMSMMMIKMLECPQIASIEGSLIEKAKQKNWEIIGLEKIQDQIAVFDAIDEKKQLDWLVTYANDPNEAKTIFNELLESYKQEDLVNMLNVIKKQPEFKEMEDALLYKRNENWIDKIATIASEKPTFFAFGAAHLGSDKGVIALLKKKGFTVKPIMD